jgi:phospholipase C
MTGHALRHGFWSQALALLPSSAALFLPLLLSGCALFNGSDRSKTPSVALSASPVVVAAGSTSTLTVTALNATQITINGSDGSTYTLPGSGGAQAVSPKGTTKYTATATGSLGTASAIATVAVSTGDINTLNHIIFLLQENHTFDNYFGMLNPYRKANGWNIGDDGVDYEVDGIDDKLTAISNQTDEGTAIQPFKFKSSCIDDASSDWLASFGDVNRYDFSTARQIVMDGFVHNAEGYAKACSQPGAGGICAGTFTDLTGKRAMGYYDQDFLNYYYYMASQFALSDRWFSPVASKSVDNRIATFSGGTTQGLVKDPGDDQLPQLDIPTIFQELDQAKVSWKIYYIGTQGGCGAGQSCTGSPNAAYPATDFSNFLYSKNYLYANPAGSACTAPTQASSVVGDTSNSFCIDPTHIAPISTYFTDVSNASLPSFAFIEAGFEFSDEHPGSGQSILVGQNEGASLMNALMQSPSWYDSAFFFAYDEGGGPYDHVPPVPGHSNDFTDASIQGLAADISGIAVSPDSFKPCEGAGGVPTLHCDLAAGDPGTTSTDAAAVQGFGAQLGFRVPNFVISPYVRKHYVSHVPMDHTAVIKLVENRFLGGASLTARDAAQPDLHDFFDFTKIPWLTPPNPPTPLTKDKLGYDPCTPSNLGP